MARQFVSDELWERIRPLLPPHRSPGPRGGRPPVADRLALEGILFILRTGLPWAWLPPQFGCSGMTCWRRLRDWNLAGVWDQLHRLLLAELREADRLDWSRAVVDSSSIRALRGGPKTGPNPTDRSRLGSKHHLVVDGQGVPLAVRLSGANQPDVMEILPLVASIPPVAGKPGRPQEHPRALYADRAYDSRAVKSVLRWLGIRPQIAARRTAHGSGLGTVRWVVERTFSWLHNFHRLRIRWERRADIHEAFLKLAVCLTASGSS
jgi:transposase